MKIPNNDNKPNISTPKPKGNKMKWFWRTLATLGVLVIIAASLGLIFNEQLMGVWVHTQTKPDVYMSVPVEEMQQNAELEGNYDGDSAVPVSPENLVKAALSKEPKPVIGGIAVPELGINLPILLDDSDYNMLYGAGPLQGGQVMGEGNYTLASHDMWTNESYYSKTLLFTPLVNAESGQHVYITDKVNVYEYIIYDKRRVAPSAWDDAVNEIPGKKTITLITCDTDDAYRILVRGELSSVKPFNDTTSEPFTAELNTYKG